MSRISIRVEIEREPPEDGSPSRSLTKSLNDVECQESVGPPVGGGAVPAHVQAPDMEADGEADVDERDGDRSAEPLHQNPDEASLNRVIIVKGVYDF